MIEDLKWDSTDFKTAIPTEVTAIDNILVAGDLITENLLTEIEVNYSPSIEVGKFAVVVNFPQPFRVLIDSTVNYGQFLRYFVSEIAAVSDLNHRMRLRRDYFAAASINGLISNVEFFRSIAHVEGNHQVELIQNTIDRVFEFAMQMDDKATELDNA